MNPDFSITICRPPFINFVDTIQQFCVFNLYLGAIINMRTIDPQNLALLPETERIVAVYCCLSYL
jgi:hypothetical protein